VTPEEREQVISDVCSRVAAQLKPLFERAAHTLEQALIAQVQRFEKRLDTHEANITLLVKQQQSIGKRLSLVEADPLAVAGGVNEWRRI
jgi:hypothetical protein